MSPSPTERLAELGANHVSFTRQGGPDASWRVAANGVFPAVAHGGTVDEAASALVAKIEERNRPST